MAEAVEPLAVTVPITWPSPDPVLTEPPEPLPPLPLDPVPRGLDAEAVALVPAPLAPALAALPTPAGIPGEPLSTPLAVATREVTTEADPDPKAVTEVVAVPEPEASPETDVVPDTKAVPEAEAIPEADADEEDDESEVLQERSYRGVVDKASPTIPKLGEGVVGAASWRVYQ